MTAWIRVPEGMTETTQVRALLDPIDITGALVTADAAHTCAETARYLVEDKKADYLLTIKGNRSSLHAAAMDGLTAGTPAPAKATACHVRPGSRSSADPAGQPLSKEAVLVATSRARLTAADIAAHVRRH